MYIQTFCLYAPTDGLDILVIHALLTATDPGVLERAGAVAIGLPVALVIIIVLAVAGTEFDHRSMERDRKKRVQEEASQLHK